MFNNAQMIEINGKEVKSIVLQDGGVLYEKEDITEPLILYFTGQQFTGRAPLVGNNIVIDWGDGTTTNYEGSTFQHTYNENAEHIITISGVTELPGSFSRISGITDVIIPNTITSITNGAFSSTQISDIVIPSNVITLGQGVFNSTPLSNIILSEGLKTIDHACFSSCNLLSKITIPYSVITMGQTIFGGTPIKDIYLLWDSSETIISYQAGTYQGISSNDYTFNIPEGTTQLYVDKGYPLAKLVEGAVSITLTSNKDIVGAGETAIITGTLNYPFQDKIMVFNTETPESVTMIPGDNYYSIGENGFDITDFSHEFSLYLKPNNEDEILTILYDKKKLSLYYQAPNISSRIFFIITPPIKLHVDKNDIIIYYQESGEVPICAKLSERDADYTCRKLLYEDEWQLNGDNSLTITKNTGLYSVTDSNGQATMEYEGVGAGDVTITGTYLDKDVSDSITITNVVAHDVGYGSYFMNSISLSRTIENDGVLITDNHPDSASEFSMWYMYILPNNQQATSMSECNIWESDKDYCIEMDIISSDASNEIQLRPQASGEFLHQQEISQLNNTTPFHLKIIVSRGISYWFIDDNNSPIYIENSIDLGESYGIRIGMMKQQSLKFNNLVIYELDEPFTLSVPSSISIQSNKTVISATNNESCILNATVLDENNNPVQNQEVTFKLGTTILNTTLTDGNGEATYEFEAKGNGNISVSAEIGDLSSNSLTIEDCIYAKMQQYDMVRSGSTAYGLLNDDIISDLPIQYSIECNIKTSQAPSSGAEHRLYWVPRELYNNGSQPSYAMFLGFASTSLIQYGVRRGSTSCVDRSCSIGSWYNLRVDKLSDRFNYYNDNTFIDWYSFGYQYNNWTFSYIIWSDTTLSVKNIKIKPFEFNGTISIEYSEATTSYILTATLTGNDIANRAVRFYKNNKYIGTSFTNSNGIATKTFNEIENEDMSFTAWCGNVESSEVIVENDINTPKIKLFADKNILSYANNESCTITATYQGETVSGQTVVFKNGETVLATKTTNSNGVATYEYESQGIGDITITAECMNLQNTCEVQDCIYYHDMTSDDSSHWTIPSSANATYSSNGMQFGGSGWADAYLEVPLTKPYSIELDLTQWSGSPCYLHYLWDSTKTTRLICFGGDTNKTYIDIYPNANNYWNSNISQGSHVKIEVNDNNLKLYVNDELKLTKSYSMPSSNILGLGKSGGNPTTWKNIKIKPFPFDGPLSVSASKDILSYADEDECVLTATLLDDSNNPVSGKTITFKNGSTVLGTDVTDVNGEATYTYSSQGVGDVTITAEYMNLQKTFTIEDCKYFNDGSSVDSLSIGSGVSCTSNGNYITITTDTSGEKYVNLPVNIMDGDEFSFELAEFGVTNDMAWQIYNTRAWGATTTDTYVINLEDNANSYYDISSHIGQILSIQYQNGICSVYFDGDLKKSKTVYLNNSNAGFYTNNGRVQHIKNIKLKPL